MSQASSIETVAKALRPFRVMVVDDSAIIRGFITRWLEAESDIQVVGSASNGEVAVANVKRYNPEVVVLDIEMPVMDGLSAIPLLLREMPDVQIIMASTLTKRNAEVSFRAMRRGAVDYVPKPEATRDMTGSNEFKDELTGKVRAFATKVRRKRNEPMPEASTAPAARPAAGVAAAAAPQTGRFPGGERKTLNFVKASNKKPQILAIGSSTGGPQALAKVLADIKDYISVPVIITQHMPPDFTTMLAEHLQRTTGRTAKEGREGDILIPGNIYVAPGDWHMTVEKQGMRHVLHLNQGPKENFCRPAVDVMYRSVAEAFGERALCVILTGMGSDGLQGGREVVSKGGTLLAQDEESSVVWGMPGAVATAGICAEVVNLDKIGQSITKLLMGGLP